MKVPVLSRAEKGWEATVWRRATEQFCRDPGLFLGRCGITPDAQFKSTAFAREIAWAGSVQTVLAGANLPAFLS